jgi:hypothetical protein
MTQQDDYYSTSTFGQEYKLIDQIKRKINVLEKNFEELVVKNPVSELQIISEEARKFLESTKKEVYDMEWRLGSHRKEVSPYGNLSEENNKKTSQDFVDNWMRNERDGLEILVKKLKEFSQVHSEVQKPVETIEKNVKKLNKASLDIYFNLIDFVTHLPH